MKNLYIDRSINLEPRCIFDSETQITHNMNLKIKLSFFLFIFFTSLNLSSQVEFQSGSIIKVNGEQISCFIKNKDWKNNPDKIQYKKTRNSSVNQLNKDEIAEFSIGKNIRYKQFVGNIDTSSTKANDISYTRNPEYKYDNILLEVLLEGEINLYKYEQSDFTLFFYSTSDNIIIPLIYKKYQNDIGKVYSNTQYKQDLKNSLNCSEAMTKKIDNLVYSERILITFFKSYASSKNYDVIQYKKAEKTKYNITLRPNLRSSRLQVFHMDPYLDTNLDYKLRPSFGLEFEYIVPFNKNKWSLILEPTYNYYKAENSNEAIRKGISKRIFLNYHSIEFPAGFRYYMYLNKKSKLFINSFFTTDIVLFGDYEFQRTANYPIKTYDVVSFVGGGVGFGYKSNKYSIELRHQSFREVLVNYIFWTTSFSTTSIHFGYSLFE